MLRGVMPSRRASASLLIRVSSRIFSKSSGKSFFISLLWGFDLLLMLNLSLFAPPKSLRQLGSEQTVANSNNSAVAQHVASHFTGDELARAETPKDPVRAIGSPQVGAAAHGVEHSAYFLLVLTLAFVGAVEPAIGAAN